MAAATLQVSVADLAGRGFASQEILEELAARDELSNKVGGSLAWIRLLLAPAVARAASEPLPTAGARRRLEQLWPHAQ